jgi:hypothetical protein
MGDMDLFARIQAQNAEMDQQSSMSQAEMRLAEHEQYAASMAYSSSAGPPPPTQQFNVVRIGGSRGRQPQQASYSQNYGGDGGHAFAPTEASLRHQERELDRQLDQERSIARGGGQQQQMMMSGGRGGPPGGMMAQRGGSGSRGKLHMPPPPSEKENRGKISLLPRGSGGSQAPPSTSGGASRYAPSCRGGAAPSVSGMTTASERERRPIHYSRLMDKPIGGGQMDSVLNPVDGIRGQMKRAGIEPKDHHRDNRRLVKEMQEMKRQQEEQKAMEEEDKRLRAQRIRDKALQKAQNTLGALSEEGAGFEHPPIGRGQGAASAGRRSMRPPPTGSEDPVNLPAPPPRRHQAGAVPAYLQRRKAEWQANAEEQAAREAYAAECPPGLRLVGAEEKARILEKLAEERAKATVELRQMPFVIKTQASQAKKDALEKRLEEIDGAEEAYQREKVFVPLDM